ncbi:hypothetical protein [Thioalkalivibrio sp. ALE19]|uniref:hypothetical protein n=1 Tax=Thioalkalivibrio sp. ALE19 TaxID=1266909 RepID=UPI0018CA8EF8|nr:hypothetical protein [Thioalkalivibrio sp. ALE19]
MVLAARVQRAMDRVLPVDHRAEPVRFFPGKADHGDLDVLLACDAFEYAEVLREALGATEMVVNRSRKETADPNRQVVSYAVPLDGDRVFQVDVVQVPARAFDFARWYFAGNDLGGLLGGVARRLGFKLADVGLLLEVDDENERVAELAVTRDWDEALAFLGYDPDAYRAGMLEGGFDTLDSLFAFVASSPYFDPSVYRPENRSGEARRRDANRPTYQAFLRWLDQRGEADPPARDVTVLRADALTRAYRTFPAFARELDELLEGRRRMKKVRQRFNGHVVAEVTGLSGPELGAFMCEFQDLLGGPVGVADWVEARSDAEIRGLLTQLADRWLSRNDLLNAEVESGLL